METNQYVVKSWRISAIAVYLITIFGHSEILDFIFLFMRLNLGCSFNRREQYIYIYTYIYIYINQPIKLKADNNKQNNIFD